MLKKKEYLQRLPKEHKSGQMEPKSAEEVGISALV